MFGVYQHCGLVQRADPPDLETPQLTVPHFEEMEHCSSTANKDLFVCVIYKQFLIIK